MKKRLANIFDKLRITNLLRSISDMVFGKKYIRVVNYHSTPKNEKENFERQLSYYKKHYEPVSLEDLEIFLSSGIWNKKKPGLIISFDDGQRSNYDFAKPLLEKYNFIGWFFIPTGFIDLPVKEQEGFMTSNEFTKNQIYKDGRYAMTWDEIIALDENHVIGSHTISHHEVSIDDSNEILLTEIGDSKKRLENILNHEISTYCWVRGRLSSYSYNAAKIILDTGYKYAFMTNTYPVFDKTNPFQLQRTNIETRDPLSVVEFQLCGFMDLYYFKKRREVIKRTSLTNILN